MSARWLQEMQKSTCVVWRAFLADRANIAEHQEKGSLTTPCVPNYSAWILLNATRKDTKTRDQKKIAQRGGKGI